MFISSKSKLKERKTKNESKLVGFVKHVDSIDNRFHRLLRICNKKLS